MKLLFLFGNAAVGKMTVGQELAQRTGLRLFHNHIMIEPVLEVFGFFRLRPSAACAMSFLRNSPLLTRRE